MSFILLMLINFKHNLKISNIFSLLHFVKYVFNLKPKTFNFFKRCFVNPHFFLNIFHTFDIAMLITSLADPGKARGCSTNTSVIHSLIKSWFVTKNLQGRHALMVEDSAFSHRIDYVTIL